MTAQPSAAPLPADRPQPNQAHDDADRDTSVSTPTDASSDESGDGQVSEGPNSLSTAETSGGGADALPDTHG